MIKHIVMWRIKDEALGMSKSDLAHKIKTDLEALKSVIPEIREIEVGANVKPADAACDVALYSAFDSLEDLTTYANHPEHLKVVEFVKQIVTERFVVDYEV